MSNLLEDANKYIEILDSLLKEDLHQHDMLFVCEGDSTPMEFCMKPSKNQLCGEVMKKLAILVDRCGGEMKFNNFHTEGVPYSIKLVNKGESLLDTNEDYFYSNYLIDCIQEKKLLDLNNYRANKSKYCSDVDVMDILNKKKTWNQADKAKLSDEEISDFDNSALSTPKKMWRKSKLPYSREEDMKILQYIIKFKAFHRVKSRLFWQEMEKKNVCNDRTWQSLKERLKNIIPKIKTYGLSEQNQSALTKGFINPNRQDRQQHSFFCSSSESEKEDEDVISANQKKTYEAHFTRDDNIAESENIKTSETTLHDYLQVMPNKCGNFSEDSVDQHCSNQVTSTINLSGTCCKSSKLMTSNSTIFDKTFQPSISSTVLEISSLSKNDDAIFERNENFDNVQSDNIIFSTNLSALTSEICKGKLEKSSPHKSLFNVKEAITDAETKDNAANVNKASDNHFGNEKDENESYEYEIETDIEDNVNKSTESYCGNEIDKNDYVDETKTDIEDNEVSYSHLSGTSIFRNDESVAETFNSNNENKEESQIIGAESQLLMIEDIPTAALDAENVKLGRSYAGGRQSQHDVADIDSNEKSLNSRNFRRKVSTIKLVNEEILSDNDSDETVSFSSDEISLNSKISLRRRKKETFIRNKPAERYENKLEDSKHLGCRSKYTLTFHTKFGCCRKLIKTNSRGVDKDSKFSIEEDISIINYIKKHGAIHYIKGNELWMSMVERESKNKRTWQSLKDRFNKRILPNIKCYESEGISKKTIDFFSEEYNERKPVVKEECKILVSPVKEECNRFYKKEEKQAIVDYIVRTQRYDQIKGKALYEAMAITMPNKRNRTWQSLKNTFIKYIMPNIKSYVKSKEVLFEFRTAWEKLRRSENAKKPPTISIETSDDESCVSDATTSSSPQIRKVKLSRTGARHSKTIEYSSSSNESDDENENIENSSSIQVNAANNSSCKNLQKKTDNIDVSKGRKVVKKRRKLFTASDELYSKTPFLGPTRSCIGNIPHKEDEEASMPSTKNISNSSKRVNTSLEPMDMEQCSDSIVKCQDLSMPSNDRNNSCKTENMSLEPLNMEQCSSSALICENLSMPSKKMDNSDKTEPTSRDVSSIEQCTNSAEICESIHAKLVSTPQKETLNRKGIMLSSFSTNECTMEPSKQEIASRSKHLSTKTLSCQVTLDEEKYSNPFQERVLGSTERVKKISSSCKVTIPQIENEVITLTHTPSKDNFDEKNNATLLFSKKNSSTSLAVDMCEQNSPPNSASKCKLRSFSNISPGKQNENNQLLDIRKRYLRQSKCEPDTKLRRNLRMRKIKNKL